MARINISLAIGQHTGEYAHLDSFHGIVLFTVFLFFFFFFFSSSPVFEISDLSQLFHFYPAFTPNRVFFFDLPIPTEFLSTVLLT
jgi:hypothetical protein